MTQIKEILLERLQKKGLDPNYIPGFIRSLANSICRDPDMSLTQLNQRLDYLGWNGIDLDYHTLQLTIACIETEGLPSLKEMPTHWFTKLFSTQEAAVIDQPDLAAEATI
jgi:hypothetical protein